MAGRGRVPVSSAIALSGAVAAPVGWWAAGPVAGIILILVTAVVATVPPILAYCTARGLGNDALKSGGIVDASCPGLSIRVGGHGTDGDDVAHVPSEDE